MKCAENETECKLRKIWNVSETVLKQEYASRATAAAVNEENEFGNDILILARGNTSFRHSLK